MIFYSCKTYAEAKANLFNMLGWNKGRGREYSIGLDNGKYVVFSDLKTISAIETFRS